MAALSRCQKVRVVQYQLLQASLLAEEGQGEEMVLKESQ